MTAMLTALAVICSASTAYEWALPVPTDTPRIAESTVCPERTPYTQSASPALAALADGTLVCVWQAAEAKDSCLALATQAPGARKWSAPRLVVEVPGVDESGPVLHAAADGTLWLAYTSGEAIKTVFSKDNGATWEGEREPAPGLTGWRTENKGLKLGNTLLLPVYAQGKAAVLVSNGDGLSFTLSEPLRADVEGVEITGAPALVKRADGTPMCLVPSRKGTDYRMRRCVSLDGGQHWTALEATEVPSGGPSIDLERLNNGALVMSLNPVPEGKQIRLSLWWSADDGAHWTAFRDLERAIGASVQPEMRQTPDGQIHMVYGRPEGSVKHVTFNEAWVWESGRVADPVPVRNVLAPLDNGVDDERTTARRKANELPIESGVVEEHLSAVEPGTEGKAYEAVTPAPAGLQKDANIPAWATAKFWLTTPEAFRQRVESAAKDLGAPVSAAAETADTLWIGTSQGLFWQKSGDAPARYADYGINGPLASRITALAVDAAGTLWAGTPAGISLRDKTGNWTYLRGKEGLPIESVTDIEFASDGDIWIGTTGGLVLYRPQATNRKWFYRAGERYLPDNQVNDVAVSPDGKTVYCATNNGVGRISKNNTTLAQRAQTIENIVNLRHRRMGMVADCELLDPKDLTKYDIGDQDNDGLWTAYHVAALSLAYSVTGDLAARESAKESMNAVLKLQDVSGIPGVVARSILPKERAIKEGKGPKNSTRKQWRPSPDENLYWLADTSNDEIDGHYMAFYTYWEHVAQFDPAERANVEAHVRTLTDSILANGYQLYDWHGQRTYWGFWSPEIVNNDPLHFLENGLGSLQMLSFLKVAQHITGDDKYKRHYEYLMREHGYLDNLQLEKKVFPDENNHSDNQLACVAWYPLLQLEWTPAIRETLHRAVRRHYRTLENDRSSFFNFVFATVDPDYVDIEGGIQNLKEIPTDRRGYRADNSLRADVQFDPRPDRFDNRQLLHVLPADERVFDKWNGNPYVAKARGSSQIEDDGSAYLLPYWMARFHGFLKETE